MKGHMMNLIAQVEEVEASKCEQCGGIPQADWLPFWVYDEYDECTCWLTEAEKTQED